MKPKSFLELHNQLLCNNNTLIYNSFGLGLCNQINPYSGNQLDRSKIFKTVSPTQKDFSELWDKGESVFFWAAGGEVIDDKELRMGYTPLRQTIILLMAALKGELD